MVFFQIYNIGGAENVDPGTVICQVPEGWIPNREYRFTNWCPIDASNTFKSVTLFIRQNRDMVLDQAYFRGNISGFFCIA